MPKLSVMIKLETKGNDAPKEFSLDYMNFLIDGNEVPVSFNAFSANTVSEDGRLCMCIETGYGVIDDNFEIEDCFDDIYRELEISRDEITAEYLSEATALVNIGVLSDVEFSRVKAIKFIDKDNGSEFEFRGSFDKCEIQMN